MKTKFKRGFTLIELMVVIAIIGILATTLAPKMREQLAKAKDAKAVSLLGAVRTISTSLIISQMTGADDTGKQTVEMSWEKLIPQMDITTKGLLTDDGHVVIGGDRMSPSGKLRYGGNCVIWSSYTAPGPLVGINNALGDSMNKSQAMKKQMEIKETSDLHLFKSSSITPSVSTYSTEGKQWTAY